MDTLDESLTAPGFTFYVSIRLSIHTYFSPEAEEVDCCPGPVIKGMLDNANLLVTAWAGNDLVDSDLVGVARCVTDFSYCCYLSDIAVLDSYQHQGIGKMLIQKIEEQLPPTCKIILLSAPQAVDYYPKIGLTQHNSAWVKTVGK